MRNGQPLSTDVRVDELLDRWEDAAARGESVDLEFLCQDCPELVEVVRRHIEALQSMDEFIENKHNGRSGGSTVIVSEIPPEIVTGHGDQVVSGHEFSDLTFFVEGGLGALFKATDRRLHRDVIVKFVHPKQTFLPESREQLKVEAEITARLEHPGVVPVYAIGQTQAGRPFYVMRHIEGRELESAIADFHSAEKKRPDRFRSREFRQLLTRLASVCNTIAYAHNRGILHKDIKPRNILLGRYGETVIIDWGLACAIDRDDQARASGEATLKPQSSQSDESSKPGGGTPAYMSPEQAQLQPLDRNSDVYSLGATLYKLLTGLPPFEGTNPHAVRQRVIDGDFPRPRAIQSDIPPALEAICQRAMSTKPTDRYDTALEMAEDIERYLADETVTAYKETSIDRVRRWGRRYRTLAQTGMIAGVLLLVLSVASALVFAHLASSERDARIAADEARNRGLQVTAQFASQSVAGEIDRRFSIIEKEAVSLKLREAILKYRNAVATGDESTKSAAMLELKHWIIEVADNNRDSANANSWFVTDEVGDQIARSPQSDSIGNNYANRDYYHGHGHDVSDSEAKELSPITEPHLSSVYISSSTGESKVAFSVPIWSHDLGEADRKVIGVLGMSLELGRLFETMQRGLDSRYSAVIVDGRPSRLAEGEPKPGMLLHHPDLVNRPNGQTNLQWLDADVLNRIETHSANGNHLVPNYHDPLLDGEVGQFLAAFSTVRVESRQTVFVPKVELAHETEAHQWKRYPWTVIVVERLEDNN